MNNTFKGNPCKRGHDGTRRIHNGDCVQCGRDRSAKFRQETPKDVQYQLKQKYNKIRNSNNPLCLECALPLPKRKVSFCSRKCSERNWINNNPELVKQKRQRFKASAYGKYVDQREAAKQRKIPWMLSFEDWIGWWGDDLIKRHGATGLMMCRFRDEGSYELGNIYKGTASDNVRDMHASRKRKAIAMVSDTA